MTRWLVTGADGALGTDVAAVLRMYGEDVVAYTRAELDVTSTAAVQERLDDVAPSVVVNCAAVTPTSAGLDDDEAFRVNADGPRRLARWCAGTETRLLHVSCAEVFAGDTSAPYDEAAAPAPATAYARGKAAGEHFALSNDADVCVVRTSWLYGAEGHNFVKDMVRVAQAGSTVNANDNAVGSPTWTLHLARALVALGVSSAKRGIYHCTSGGEATRYVVARAVLAELGLDPAQAEPGLTTDAVPHAVLGQRRWRAAGLPQMAHWRDALHEAFIAVGEDLAL